MSSPAWAVPLAPSKLISQGWTSRVGLATVANSGTSHFALARSTVSVPGPGCRWRQSLHSLIEALRSASCFSDCGEIAGCCHASCRLISTNCSKKGGIRANYVARPITPSAVSHPDEPCGRYSAAVSFFQVVHLRRRNATRPPAPQRQRPCGERKVVGSREVETTPDFAGVIPS
jgi:hypothetical protein